MTPLVLVAIAVTVAVVVSALAKETNATAKILQSMSVSIAFFRFWVIVYLSPLFFTG
jgi:hypothetical protein